MAGIDSCEALHENGATNAFAQSDPSGDCSFCSRSPWWDRKLRRLSFDGRVVKRFRLPAGNQEAVLSAKFLRIPRA